MSLSIKSFEDASQLTLEFAAQIVSVLTQAIAERGCASLVVSGGSTPVPLFGVLANSVLDWSRVVITLADERWVSPSESASNERLVREHLLVQHAAAATFVSPKTSHADASDAIAEVNARTANIPIPFDVVILGMGEDGHTASLFPCSSQLQQGLDTQQAPGWLAVTPTTAPHQRISMNLSLLLQARNIYLHLTGQKKRAVLEHAIATNDENQTPIVAVINRTPVTLMWAP